MVLLSWRIRLSPYAEQILDRKSLENLAIRGLPIHMNISHIINERHFVPYISSDSFLRALHIVKRPSYNTIDDLTMSDYFADITHSPLDDLHYLQQKSQFEQLDLWTRVLSYLATVVYHGPATVLPSPSTISAKNTLQVRPSNACLKWILW